MVAQARAGARGSPDDKENELAGSADDKENELMADGMKELRTRLSELIDLRNASHLLHWDQQTNMPPRGGTSRADSLATLERIIHEQFVDDETGRLLEEAAGQLNGTPSDSDDASLVRVVRRRWDKARLVPSELAAELAKAASVGQEAWVVARENSDFKSFTPYLEHNLSLARQYVDCFDGFDCAYDVLLDDYDPGTKTATVARLFAELRSELVPLIATVAEHSEAADDSCLHGDFPIEIQRRLVAETVDEMGFASEGWRMDDAVHPFATSIGAGDVRITTRWDPAFFASGLFGAMHECGHGLYEDGIAPGLKGTPLGQTDSLAVHESQSRMWENMVGRGVSYSNVLAARINNLFGVEVAPDVMYRAVNRVQPSHIRVEADEATYGLHIVLRFELEQELIENRLAAHDLPEAWNARFKEYFGIDVPDDSLGVLQDVHWSAGLIGYFPTYAMGNLIAGQLWERAHVDLPELEQQIAAGELLPLREWLREHVHRHGAKFTSRELLDRVVGGPIAVAPFVSYLKAKLGDVYGINL
jgi:carboxypeptidase Taq